MITTYKEFRRRRFEKLEDEYADCVVFDRMWDERYYQIVKDLNKLKEEEKRDSQT